VLPLVDTFGFDPARLTNDQAIVVMDRLARSAGLVGITARFTLPRLTPTEEAAPPTPRADASQPRSQPAPFDSGPPSSKSQPVSAVRVGTIPLADLIALLASSMGNEKAEELVREAARGRTVVAGAIAQPDALGVLEELARQPGLVGVTARFAKARLALRSAG
jgi:hypothetical protein